MGGNTEIRNEAQKASGIRFQSSMFGGVVPVLHGTNLVPPNLLDYGDFTAYQHQSTESQGGKGGGGVDSVSVWYTYTADVIFGLVEGPIKSISKAWKGKVASTDLLFLLGDQGGSVSTAWGHIDQAPVSFLSTMAGGAHNINYSGVAVLGVMDYDLGDSAQVENHRFEVRGYLSDKLDGVPDAPPALVLYDWVSSLARGLGQFGVIEGPGVGSTDDFDRYTRASGIWISPLLQEQAPATDRLAMLERICNAALIEVDGMLRMVPLGGSDLSRQIGADTVTWSARTAPQYELDPDSLLSRGVDQPLVEIKRTPAADAFNIVEIEFRDRSADYAPSVARKVDQASVDALGEKPAAKLTMDWICDAAVADRVAQNELNRHMVRRAKYSFDLPWNFVMLMPTAIVTLTVPEQGLEALPVRITRREETDAGYTFEAEDYSDALSAQPLHTLPVVDGFRNDYSALPGATTAHAVFEAPKALSDGLELWIAATGSNASWGGCHVWISADGVEYKQVGTLTGKSRVGRLDEAASASVPFFSVKGLNDQLGSGSALDASLNATLCWAGGEFFNYQTATLTAAGAYTLTGLLRGVYGSKRSSKAADSVFVRCDGALAKTGPIGLQMVGRQVWIKLQSFNIFGLSTQSLADVTAVTYTPTGDLTLAPDELANLVPEGEFSLLPVGRKPDTWDGGTVTEVSGQAAFTGALDCSALRTQGLSRIRADQGGRFWVLAMLDTAGSGTGASVGVAWYDADGVRLSFSRADAVLAAGTAWTPRAAMVEAPAGSAWGVPCVERSAAGSGVCRVADVAITRQLVSNELKDQSATEVVEVVSSGFSVTGLNQYETDYAVLWVAKGTKVIVRCTCEYLATNSTGSSVSEISTFNLFAFAKYVNDVSTPSAPLTWPGGASGAGFLRNKSLAAFASDGQKEVLSMTFTTEADCFVFVGARLSGVGFLGPGGQQGGNGAVLSISNLSIIVEVIKK
jgi:Putative phage tail protein